jgi:molecular chaperone DnaJ
MTTRDLYEVLGVAKDAPQDEIKTAYRRLARQYHPDVNPDNPESEEQFKEIGNAYNILSDPDKRARYDQFGTVDDVPQDPFFQGSASINDIFDMFFGGGMGGGNGRNRTAQNGADLQTRVQISLKEVITGASRDVNVNRMVACPECSGTGAEGGAMPETCSQCGGQGAVSRIQNTFIGQVRTSVACPTCSGTGQIIKNPCSKCRGSKLISQKATIPVTIPPGIETGTSMRVSNQGNEGVGGGRPGDLYVGVVVEDHDNFERQGQDLHTGYAVKFAQAALGDELTIEGIDDTYTVDLPSGVQPGEILTVKAAGLPPLHGGRRGSIYVHINVEVPSKLNDAQREAIVALAEAGGEPIPKGEKKDGILGGLFKKKR